MAHDLQPTGLGKGRGLHTTLQLVPAPNASPRPTTVLGQGLWDTQKICVRLITVPRTWDSPLGRKGEAWEAEKSKHLHPNQD